MDTMPEDQFTLATRRPDGVAMFSGIQWPCILLALSAVVMLYVGNQLEGSEVGFSAGHRVLMGYLLVRSLLAGPLALGLWRLKRWAWNVAVGDLVLVGTASVLWALSGATSYSPDGNDTSAVFVWVVVVAIWLVYLVRPSVRRSFDPPPPENG